MQERKGGDRMEIKKIKTKLFEKGVTYSEASQKIGISKYSFTKKVNGKSKFSVDEAEKLSRLLELSNDEIVNIFFN